MTPASGLTAAAGAQRVEAVLDAGATGIRYGDSISAAAATLSPSVRLESQHVTLGAAASISELGTGAWAAQASLGASAFSPPIGTLRGELAASGGGSTHEDGTHTGQLEALGRVHFMRRNGGLWAGGGAGRAWDGASGHTLALGDAGAWLHRDSFTAVLSATPTAVDDSIRYIDMGLAVRWLHPRAEIGTALGARAGHGLIGPARHTVWGTIAAVLWLAPRVGIVASAGTYPPDFAQGFPNGRFVSLAVRLDSHPQWRRESAESVVRLGGEAGAGGHTPSAEHGGVEQFVAVSSDDKQMIRVHAPRAIRVEIAGDMTNWTPVALTSTGDGWWSITLAVAAGMHQLSLRLDAGHWVAPPGLVAVTDEFGGAAGVWSVP